MKPTDFLSYHKTFSNEVYQAIGCYVMWKSLMNKPADDNDLLQAMNQTPRSWLLIRHSLMQSLIMTLGRIFDTSGETVSIDDLIKSCAANVGEFSKEALRQRKMQGSDTAEKWIDEFLSKAYEPDTNDFTWFRGDIAKHRKMYKTFYQPIRHNIFAHMNKDHLEKQDKLWEATKDSNVEDILNFLHDLDRTIFDAFHNGVKPELKQRTYDEAWFEMDISQLLNNFKEGSH